MEKASGETDTQAKGEDTQVDQGKKKEEEKKEEKKELPKPY